MAKEGKRQGYGELLMPPYGDNKVFNANGAANDRGVNGIIKSEGKVPPQLEPREGSTKK